MKLKTELEEYWKKPCFMRHFWDDERTFDHYFFRSMSSLKKSQNPWNRDNNIEKYLSSFGKYAKAYQILRFMQNL